MRITTLAITTVLAFTVLTACGGDDPDSGPAELKVDEGAGGAVNLSVESADGTFTARSDPGDTDAPFGLSLPDDAEVLNNVRLQTDDTTTSHTVIFTTSQSPEALMADYQQATEADGFSVTHSGATRKGWLLSSKRGDRENLRVVIEESGAATVVNITSHVER